MKAASVAALICAVIVMLTGAAAQAHPGVGIVDDGAPVVVARSRGDWSPSGGVFDRDGALWLLEYSSTNAVRVRRIARDGSERAF